MTGAHPPTQFIKQADLEECGREEVCKERLGLGDGGEFTLTSMTNFLPAKSHPSHPLCVKDLQRLQHCEESKGLIKAH